MGRERIPLPAEGAESMSGPVSIMRLNSAKCPCKLIATAEDR